MKEDEIHYNTDLLWFGKICLHPHSNRELLVLINQYITWATHSHYIELCKYVESKGRRNSRDCWTSYPNNLPREVQLAKPCIMASPASYFTPQKRTKPREDLNVAKPCSSTLRMSLLKVTSEL